MGNLIRKAGAVFLAWSVFTGMVQIHAEETENTDSSYPLACQAYEVDQATADGSFEKVDCYETFEEAKGVMENSGDNAVVRHTKAYSPTRIIAMNGGIAYAHPGRSSQYLLTFYNAENPNASSYMPSDYGMFYKGTEAYNGDGTGTIHMEVSGFEGNAPLRDVDLIPFVFIENNAVVKVGGNEYNGRPAQAFAQNQTHYTVEQHGAYLDLVLKTYTDNGYSASNSVGPAASWMKAGDVYYSSDDIHYYWDAWHRSEAGTYYNYYQFAPLRTQSRIPAERYNAYLTKVLGASAEGSKLWNTGEMFLNGQSEYGINAAMIFAQACVESANGTSHISQRNNLFGINAIDTDPNQAYDYKTVEACIQYQMGSFLRDYMDVDDWRFYGSSFGNKGTGITVKYASAINYGAVLASIYYEFDKSSKNYDGTLTDYHENSFGIVNTPSTWVYSKADTNSKKLFDLRNANGYMKDVSVSIIGEEGDFYKVQSQNYLDSDGSVQKIEPGKYLEWDWDQDAGYVLKSHVDVVVMNPIKGMDSPIYRLYNPYTGEHLYTMDQSEYESLQGYGWKDEHIAWTSPTEGSVPVYRLYNSYEDTHIYTTDKTEYDQLEALGWTGEDVSFFSAEGSEAKPVYRLYNPYSERGLHLFTMSEEEYQTAIEAGWNDEDFQFNGNPAE
jgi:beta-N-acetylglucosaminidase